MVRHFIDSDVVMEKKGALYRSSVQGAAAWSKYGASMDRVKVNMYDSGYLLCSGTMVGLTVHMTNIPVQFADWLSTADCQHCGQLYKNIQSVKSNYLGIPNPVDYSSNKRWSILSIFQSFFKVK